MNILWKQVLFEKSSFGCHIFVTYSVGLVWKSYCFLLEFQWKRGPCNTLCTGFCHPTNRLYGWHIGARDRWKSNCVLWRRTVLVLKIITLLYYQILCNNSIIYYCECCKVTWSPSPLEGIGKMLLNLSLRF